MKLFLLTLLTTFFISCSSTINVKKENLRDYFWQINEYDNPKVLVFELDSAGVKNKVYYKMKKVSAEKLEVTRYMGDYSLSGILIDHFKKEGVFLERYTLFNARGESSEVVITKGFIFPFNSIEDVLSTDCTYKINGNPSNSLRYVDSWKIQKLIKQEINGENLPTLISSGTSTRYFVNPQTNQKDSFQVKMQINYTRGIGITKFIQVLPWFTFSETYLETISIEDFEKLQ